MRSNKNSRRGQRKPTRQSRNGQLISHPPQILGIETVHSVTARFRVTAAATTSISFQNILDIFLVATSATTGTDLYQTVRIRRIRVWGMPAIGATGSVSVEYSGATVGVTGDQRIQTDTSMGIQPAHVDAKPNPHALCSEFNVSTSAVAVTLGVLAGSVVDCEFTFRGPTYGIAGVAAANALVGATTGAQYLRGLDGLALATSNFVPEYTPGQI